MTEANAVETPKTEFNIEEITPQLEANGYVVKKKEELENLTKNLESLKKEELKKTWDLIDKTIYEKTGLEKKIRDDNGLERSVEYYQRALDTILTEKKGLSKQAETYSNELKEYKSQLEALKSENPEAKYEEKYKELQRRLKETEERAENEKKELGSKYQREIFEKEINSNIDALRGQLKKDVPYLEDIIDSKKRSVMRLESKTLEDGKRVFYNNGEPLINEDGSFKSVSDIVKGGLTELFDSTKVIEGTGGEQKKASLNVKQFNNAQEMDSHLKEKYGNAVGSKEWREERAELKSASGL